MQSAKLPLVSEQMKAWSAALAGEVTDWPKVTGRSFFGFTALYRRDRIFGVLPRTRGWGTGNCVAFKIESPTSVLRARLEKNPRIGSMEMQKARWFTFEIASDADLHEAMDWLARAYEAAGKIKKSKQFSLPCDLNHTGLYLVRTNVRIIRSEDYGKSFDSHSHPGAASSRLV